MKGRKVAYQSGAICVFTDEDGELDFAQTLRETHREMATEFALVFFSKSRIAPDALADFMAKNAPELRYAACSTAGELTPSGVTEGQILILLLPQQHFAVSATGLHFEKSDTLEESATKVAVFRREFQARCETQSKEATSFAMCMTDGMSFSEETVAATLHWGLDDLPLFGGSAGDGLNFSATSLILNGEMVGSGTILLLICCSLPLQIFKTENFVPTPRKLVVTRSDPEKRIVYEFNAADAAQTYAEIVGVDPQSLSPMTFASHPLVMRVGNEFYCRSIQKVNDDGSLSFFCAIDDGIVLTVAEPTGMARTTETALETVKTDLGEIDFVLGFDCVLRRIDAHNRQVTHKISKLYEENHVIGFNTYGEQYRSMHLNQTLTGIAFGAPKSE